MTKPKPKKLRSRIKRTERLTRDQLTLNPDNFRDHDEAQLRAIRDGLDEFGTLVPILAARIKHNGKMATVVIDGEGRVRAARKDEPLDVAILDLNKAERAFALSILDPSSKQAGTDIQNAERLLQRAEANAPGVHAVLATIEDEVNRSIKAIEDAQKETPEDEPDNEPAPGNSEPAAPEPKDIQRPPALMVRCNSALDYEFIELQASQHPGTKTKKVTI